MNPLLLPVTAVAACGEFRVRIVSQYKYQRFVGIKFALCRIEVGTRCVWASGQTHYGDTLRQEDAVCGSD